MRKQKCCVAFLHLRLYHLAFLATYSLLRGLKRNDTDSTGAFSGSRSDPLGNKELFFYSFTLFFYPLSLCQIPPVTNRHSSSCCYSLHHHPVLSYFFIYIFTLYIYNFPQYPEYANTFHYLGQFGWRLSSFPKVKKAI